MTDWLAFLLERLERWTTPAGLGTLSSMSGDKLNLLFELARKEAQTPSPRSPEVLLRLRELATLWQATLTTEAQRDRRVARALELMRADLARGWTVASLAKAVGMSRAAFARRFAAEFGQAPLRHLYRERMERAAALLRTTDESLRAVAALVGYESEFAFSRAFKRHHGVAPGVYRKRAAHVSGGARMRLAA